MIRFIDRTGRDTVPFDIHRQSVYAPFRISGCIIRSERVGKNLEGMNKTESKLYRLQLEVLQQARWKKMLARVDFGRELEPYKPVPCKVSRNRANSYLAAADAKEIVFEKRHAKAGYTELFETLRHEMIHVLLAQNRIPSGHNMVFMTCCSIMGLNHWDQKEAPKFYRYTYKCPQCSWWYKSNSPRVSTSCGNCGGMNIAVSEKIDNKSWMKIKSGKDGGPTTLLLPPEVKDASVIHTPSVSAIPSVTKSTEGNT